MQKLLLIVDVAVFIVIHVCRLGNEQGVMSAENLRLILKVLLEKDLPKLLRRELLTILLLVIELLYYMSVVACSKFAVFFQQARAVCFFKRIL